MKKVPNLRLMPALEWRASSLCKNDEWARAPEGEAALPVTLGHPPGGTRPDHSKFRVVFRLRSRPASAVKEPGPRRVVFQDTTTWVKEYPDRFPGVGAADHSSREL